MIGFDHFIDLHYTFSRMLGVVQSPSTIDALYRDPLSKSQKDLLIISSIISRSILTLERLFSLGSGLSIEADAHVQDMKDISTTNYLFKLGELDASERALRRLLADRSANEPFQSKLRIQGFSICEQCLGECSSTCAIGANSEGIQMPWGLFDEATSSDEISISTRQPVWLDDGEVLLYSQGGKKLFDAVERLVKFCGCATQLTTAGLIPPNRELGLEFFNSLQNLGAYATDVHINLSFKFYYGFIKSDLDIERYIQCVRETIDAISKSGCNLYIILMADEAIRQKTLDAFEQVKPNLARLQYYLPSTLQCRSPAQIGNAAGNLAFKESSTDRCQRFCDLKFTIRPDASLTLYCPRFGTRGSRIGNVLENDSGQLYELWRVHNARFIEEIARAEHPCLAHQRWQNGTFTAPRSDKPLIRLRC
ncbi:MAG: hypothetical protein WCT31_04345 [Candidatus Micrarchaeia archaeon]